MLPLFKTGGKLIIKTLTQRCQGKTPYIVAENSHAGFEPATSPLRKECSILVS